MPETRRDVSLSVVIRIDRTGNWVEWSTGHRSIPEVLAVAESLVSLPAIAEIRFDRITRTTERLSLNDLATEPEQSAAVPTSSPPAVLSTTERDMLRYALDLAQDQMASRGDEFTEDDQAAVDALRRITEEAR